MLFSFDDLTGTVINYFGHCKRQAWLYTKGFRMEQASDLVRKGKWIDEHTFSRNDQVYFLFENIKTDFIIKGKNPVEVHEIKSSRIPKNEHKLQLGFYLLKLEQSGIRAIGILHYPETKEKIRFSLDEIRDELINTLKNLLDIINGECPQRLEQTKCKGCGYYELCYSNQGMI